MDFWHNYTPFLSGNTHHFDSVELRPDFDAKHMTVAMRFGCANFVELLAPFYWRVPISKTMQLRSMAVGQFFKCTMILLI